MIKELAPDNVQYIYTYILKYAKLFRTIRKFFVIQLNKIYTLNQDSIEDESERFLSEVDININLYNLSVAPKLNKDYKLYTNIFNNYLNSSMYIINVDEFLAFDKLISAAKIKPTEVLFDNVNPCPNTLDAKFNMLQINSDIGFYKSTIFKIDFKYPITITPGYHLGHNELVYDNFKLVDATFIKNDEVNKILNEYYPVPIHLPTLNAKIFLSKNTIFKLYKDSPLLHVYVYQSDNVSLEKLICISGIVDQYSSCKSNFKGVIL